jgi:hypothetical protein
MVVQNNITPLVPALSTGTSLTGSISSSATSSAGFASQLASEIESFLSQSGNGSQIEIDVQNGSTAGEYKITVTDPSASTAATPAAPAATTPATTASSAPDSLMDAHVPLTNNLPVPVPVSTLNSTPLTSTAATTASASTPTAAQLAQMTPDESYWAEQPPAVRALQNMDPADRAAAGLQLAQQGYTIDVPIQVWGWDPLTTMVERQNYGYTWVPSALQSPVTLAPGLSFPGLANYQPDNPPAVPRSPRRLPLRRRQSPASITRKLPCPHRDSTEEGAPAAPLMRYLRRGKSCDP